MVRIRYPEVEIRQQFLPTKDFNLDRQFGRFMKVPSDVIPTVSQGIAQGPYGPRAMQADSNGAIYVNNVGSSGGGSGGAMPAPTQSVVCELHGSNPGTHSRQFFQQANPAILAFTVNINWNNGYPQPFPAQELATLAIQDVTTGTKLYLAQFRHNSPTATGVPTSPDTTLNYVFPGGLKLQPAIPADPNDQYFLELFNATEVLLYECVLILGSVV